MARGHELGIGHARRGGIVSVATRIALCLLLTLARVVVAQEKATDDDLAIVQTLLATNAVPDLVKNWQVEPPAEIVVRDRLIGCILPHGNHSIPAEIARRCKAPLNSAFMPSMRVASTIDVVFEDGTIVAAEFRKDPAAWSRRHPLGIGAIELGRPVYNEDRSLAGISFSRFRNGIGGGIFFCLLQRTSNGWTVLRQETILME